MEDFVENGAYNNITNQVINLLKNNLITNSSEYFDGWCENGDIFREESTDIQMMDYIMKEVNALVGKLEELRQFNETFKECVRLFNFKTIEELDEILKENKSIAVHKVNKDTIKIVYNGIEVTLVNSIRFLGELWIVQEDYKILDYYNYINQIYNKSKKVSICANWGTMNCPNSSKCFSHIDKPYYKPIESIKLKKED